VAAVQRVELQQGRVLWLRKARLDTHLAEECLAVYVQALATLRRCAGHLGHELDEMRRPSSS
jgi:hypothetical protein